MSVKYFLPFHLTLIAILLLNVEMLHAQKKWNAEIRPSVNFPCNVDDGLHKHVGFGIEGTARFNLSTTIGAYAGWGWNLFPANNNADFSYEETGFTFGLQYMYRVHDLKPAFFVAAGGVYNHIEVENDNDHSRSDGQHGLGWQTEAGVVFDIFGKFLLKPGLRYRNLQATGLRYFSLGTGFFF